MSHVWANSKQKGAALLLLLAMADIADEVGDCYPSADYLAKKTRVDVRSVQRTVAKLIGEGELIVFEKQGTKNRSGQKTNLYRIVMTTVEEALTIPVPKRGDTSVTSNPRLYVVRRKVVTPASPQEVTPAPPDPSVDPSVKDQKKKEVVVVAPDVFFHPVFLEVTNTPAPQREPDDVDFLIELFGDYFGMQLIPTRQQVIADIEQYTFVAIRHALEEARLTNKSGVVQWAYIRTILERRYQQQLDRAAASTPHDQLLGMRRGYQAETPEDSMIYTHPLWQAFRDRGAAKTTVVPNIPPLLGETLRGYSSRTGSTGSHARSNHAPRGSDACQAPHRIQVRVFPQRHHRHFDRGRTE